MPGVVDMPFETVYLFLLKYENPDDEDEVPVNVD
jgi:hypothetical protein